MNTGGLAHLSLLKKYGPLYFCAAEYEQLWKQQLGNYYRLLARSLFCAKPREFWEYHKSRLAEIGEPFQAGRLTMSVAGLIAESLLEPKSTFAAIAGRVRRRSSAKSAVVGSGS